MINLAIQRLSYPDASYLVQNVPQTSPNTHNSSFEAKVLKALERLEINTQIFHSYTQSITKLETQIG